MAWKRPGALQNGGFPRSFPLLAHLEIRSLATLDRVSCEFSEGLNIISGMSGAGKSVLLKAIDLSLGGRFSQKLIAERADEAQVSALFLPPKELLDAFGDEIEVEDDGQWLVRRVFRRSGRSSQFINDRLCSMGLLKRVGDELARLLSQDESLGLREPAQQLLLLDSFSTQASDLVAMNEKHASWKKTLKEIEDLENAGQEQAQKRQFLEYQLAELEKLNLVPGESEELEAQVRLLSGLSDIQGALASIQEAGSSLIETLPDELDRLESATGGIEGWDPLIEEGRSLLVGAEEWLRALADFGSSQDLEIDDLPRLEERLVVLRGAFKRHGMDEAELIAHQDALRAELEAPPLEFRLEKLREQAKVLEQEAKGIADALHRQRSQGAKKLIKKVNQTLEELEMDGDRFSISLDRSENLAATGDTELAFLLKPTADATANPLHECASGGERSRALLALSGALRGKLGTPLLIFDEIDTNIGSRLGRPIADTFLALSKGAQVICVTHLAPVAACGHRHLLVEKGQRHSQIRDLDREARIEEIAHMTAGERKSTKALEQAEAMLQQFQETSA